MEDRFDIVTLAAATCIAGYVAISLNYVALYDFGLSREQVRSDSVIAALIIAALVTVDFLGKKLGNAK